MASVWPVSVLFVSPCIRFSRPLLVTGEGRGGGAQVPYSILANLKDLIKLFKMSILCGLREYSVWACECWLHILFLDQETEGGK